MIILGLVLLAATITLGCGALQSNTDSAHLTIFGSTMPLVNTQGEVFFCGAMAGVFFMASLILVIFGIRRAIWLRQDLRNLREDHEQSLTTLTMEYGRLQRELARVRADTGALPADTTTHPSPTSAFFGAASS